MLGGLTGRPATRVAPATKTPPGAGPSRPHRPRASRNYGCLGSRRIVVRKKKLWAPKKAPRDTNEKLRDAPSTNVILVTHAFSATQSAIRPGACYSPPGRTVARQIVGLVADASASRSRLALASKRNASAFSSRRARKDALLFSPREPPREPPTDARRRAGVPRVPPSPPKKPSRRVVRSHPVRARPVTPLWFPRGNPP